MHRLARLIQPPFRAAALASLLMASLSGAMPAQSKPQALRFVVITKLSQGLLEVASPRALGCLSPRFAKRQ